MYANLKSCTTGTDDTDTAVQYRHIHAFCAKKYIIFNSLILFIFVIDSTLEILFATTSKCTTHHHPVQTSNISFFPLKIVLHPLVPLVKL